MILLTSVSHPSLIFLEFQPEHVDTEELSFYYVIALSECTYYIVDEHIVSLICLSDFFTWSNIRPNIECGEDYWKKCNMFFLKFFKLDYASITLKQRTFEYIKLHTQM